MKISYNWLNQYIETDLSPVQMSDILTNIGLEVEGMESFQSVMEERPVWEAVEARVITSA